MPNPLYFFLVQGRLEKGLRVAPAYRDDLENLAINSYFPFKQGGKSKPNEIFGQNDSDRPVRPGILA
jgi:hypothetical protein